MEKIIDPSVVPFKSIRLFDDEKRAGLNCAKLPAGPCRPLRPPHFPIPQPIPAEDKEEDTPGVMQPNPWVSSDMLVMAPYGAPLKHLMMQKHCGPIVCEDYLSAYLSASK